MIVICGNDEKVERVESMADPECLDWTKSDQVIAPEMGGFHTLSSAGDAFQRLGLIY